MTYLYLTGSLRGYLRGCVPFPGCKYGCALVPRSGEGAAQSAAAFPAMRPGVQGRGYAQRTGSASLHSSPAPEQLCFVRNRVPCKTSFAEEHSAAKQTCLKTAGVEGVMWNHVQFGSEKGKAQKHTFSARYHEQVLPAGDLTESSQLPSLHH